MERAKYIRCLRPTILLGMLIFVIAVFLPLDNARCEDVRRIVEIYSKNTEGPVIVPNLDYGEPGHDPFGVSFSGNIIDDDPSCSIDNNIVFHNRMSVNKDIIWFIKLFLNQSVFFAH